jgi:hypothetical protein
VLFGIITVTHSAPVTESENWNQSFPGTEAQATKKSVESQTTFVERASLPVSPAKARGRGKTGSRPTTGRSLYPGLRRAREFTHSNFVPDILPLLGTRGDPRVHMGHVPGVQRHRIWVLPRTGALGTKRKEISRKTAYFCEILAKRSAQGIPPLQFGKACEVGIGGSQDAAMFYC